jgi:hypothetical protein
MHNYDEVYAYLSENNFEDQFIDFENDQLLGEEAFLLDSLVQRMKRTNIQSNHKKKMKKIENPKNPIQI